MAVTTGLAIAKVVRARKAAMAKRRVLRKRIVMSVSPSEGDEGDLRLLVDQGRYEAIRSVGKRCLLVKSRRDDRSI